MSEGRSLEASEETRSAVLALVLKPMVSLGKGLWIPNGRRKWQLIARPLDKKKSVKTQPIPKITKTSEDGSSLPEAFDPTQVIAVIPAYNEERFIGSVVLKTLPYVREVIVVDDGSTDGTGSLAALAGALVIRHEKNQGKGSALNTGLAAANQYLPEAIVILDADGQHCIEDLPKVVTPILDGKADLVIGSRVLRANITSTSSSDLGALVFQSIYSSRCLVLHLHDSQSGFRAFSQNLLSNFFRSVRMAFLWNPRCNS